MLASRAEVGGDDRDRTVAIHTTRVVDVSRGDADLMPRRVDDVRAVLGRARNDQDEPKHPRNHLSHDRRKPAAGITRSRELAVCDRRCYGLAMSLRASPAIEHVALPGGGTVTVWVGVPDDPYIDDKSQLTTVDVQLREGRSVLASVSTVLEPEDVVQGVALAREVRAALEAGEIGLHAHDLEPFADRRR